MDTTTSLFQKFKQQDSGILTSCGAELQELMHQIDVMVRHKKMEWESQLHKVEDRLEIREQELLQAKLILNQKHKEIAFMQNKLENYENGKNSINVQHEQNINHLKSELNKLKHAYSNLQKHYQKKGFSSEKEKQLNKELDTAKQQLEIRVENEVKYSKRESEWEVERKVMQHQIECLESQRKSFSQKCERVQQQILVYQSRLKRSNELVEEVEVSSQGLVKKLEAELINDKNLIQRQEEIIEELQEKCRQLDNMRRITVNEKYKLQEDVDKLSCEMRTLGDEAQDLRTNLSIREASIKDGKHEVVELRNRVSDLENMLHVKQQLIESLQLRSPKSREEDLKRNISHLESLVETYRNTESNLREENSNLKQDLEYSREQIQALTKTVKNTEISQLSTVNQEIRQLRGKVDDMEMSHTMELCGMKADVTNLSSQLAKKDINVEVLGQTCKVINHKLQEETEKRNFLANELTSASESLNNLHHRNTGLSELGPLKETFATSLASAKKDFLTLKQDYQKAVKKLEEENLKLEDQVNEVRDEVAKLSRRQHGNNLHNGNMLHGENNSEKITVNTAPDFRLQKNESIIKKYLEEDAASKSEEIPASRKQFLKSIGITSSVPSVSSSLCSDTGSKLTVNAILGGGSEVVDEDNDAAEKFMLEEEPRIKDLENRIDSHIKNMQQTMQATIQKLMQA